mmetsp:Transcript_39319/g.70535  ORF Transcript_39319/g.70535 Transcript_39319/m.70535 type:complete len:206 (+) Transcript_39319:958-1575(+)
MEGFAPKFAPWMVRGCPPVQGRSSPSIVMWHSTRLTQGRSGGDGVGVPVRLWLIVTPSVCDPVGRVVGESVNVLRVLRDRLLVSVMVGMKVTVGVAWKDCVRVTVPVKWGTVGVPEPEPVGEPGAVPVMVKASVAVARLALGLKLRVRELLIVLYLLTVPAGVAVALAVGAWLRVADALGLGVAYQVCVQVGACDREADAVEVGV